MDKQLLDQIFLAYDIRGIVEEQLDENFYNLLGKALVKFWNAKVIAVGTDMKKSSVPFSQGLISGINEMGCDVYHIGEVITEVGYFAAGTISELDGVVMVTASHNPKEYNGAKLIGKNAALVAGNAGFDEIKKIILENDFTPAGTKGKVIKKDLIQDYKKKVLSFVDISKIRDLNVVVDAGNGLGGKFFDIVFGDFPLNVTRMYFEPDGNFPNHVPNPAEEENTKEVRAKTKELDADLGIAFDGDADRTSFIDSKGRSPTGYYTGPILATHLIKKTVEQSPKVVHDNRMIWAPRERIAEEGGTPIMTKSGRSFLREAMQKHDALFGFEATSHMYYKDYFFWDSGMITTVLMLEIVSQSGKKLSELCDKYYEKYPISGEINFQITNLSETLNLIKEKFKDGKLDETDGVSFEFSDWRFNLRGSNTQPIARLNIEARNESLIPAKIQLFKELLGEEYSRAGK